MYLNVKSLYLNVPLKEAIEIGLQKLYRQKSVPEIQRATMKRLLNMAVAKYISSVMIHGMCRLMALNTRHAL